MLVIVLLAHPRPGSLNHAVAERAGSVLRAAGCDVRVHDLYADGFDPVLRAGEAYTSGDRAHRVTAVDDDPVLDRYRAELGQARGLVAVHPNWWGKPPAILSGWLDRVLVPGVAYRLADGGGEPLPLLRLRRLLVVNTSDTPAEREQELFGDPLALVWCRCLPPYLGDPQVERLVLRVVAGADQEQRAAWLADVERRATRLAGALRSECGQAQRTNCADCRDSPDRRIQCGDQPVDGAS